MPYRYRWTSDFPASIDGHTTPEGNGVSVHPGKEFTTVEPVDHPFARPVEIKELKFAPPEPTKET